MLDRYDLCGSDVDRAARIETLSGAEQVLLSPQTKALAEELEGLRFHSHSRFYLKGLGWSEVFELLWNGREPRRPHGSSQDRYPGPRSDFVGRTRELGELRKRLNESRLVTLTGPGGMGKTRVAMEIVRHSDAEPWAARGVSFASLDQIAVDTEQAVHDALVASLQLDPASAGGAISALQAELRGGPSLLVIDNCETAPQSVATTVFELLTCCPQLRILATSQRQLGVLTLEAVFNLQPMSSPVGEVATVATLESLDSYQMFVASARRTEPSWNVAETDVKTLARILRLTDGVPLAIELVAAAVPYSSLGEIATELAATPLGEITDAEDIAGTVAGPLRERHRSLLRCFEWSFMHLTDAERDGFTRLGVFAENFTEAAVRQVCEIEAPRKLLSRLMRASLVKRRADVAPSRYSMLRITRAFARLKAGAAGIGDQLETRYVQFFSDLVTPSSEGDEVEQVIAWEHDWPDLLAAAYLAQKLGDQKAVWQISRSLGPFLMHRGLWLERERLNRAAIVAAEQAKAWAPLQRSLLDLGVVLEAKGHWDDALAVFRRSLDLAQSYANPSPSPQAMTLQRMGRVLERMGRVKDAQGALEELARLTPQLSKPKSRANSLFHEGRMLEKQGRWLDAEAKYRESLRIFESCGDAEGIAYGHGNLGVILTLRGDWDAAERELRRSLLQWRDIGSTKHQGIVLTQLGDMFRRRGQYQDAQRCLEESLQLRVDSPKGRAVTLGMLGRILRSQRNWPDAEKALRSSLKISESLSDAEGEGRVYDELGTTYMFQRRWPEAAAAFE